MNLGEIIQTLKAERARIDDAIMALEAIDGIEKPRAPRGVSTKPDRVCPNCGLTFRSLNRHLAECKKKTEPKKMERQRPPRLPVGTNGHGVQCIDCGARFADARQLGAHIDTAHYSEVRT